MIQGCFGSLTCHYYSETLPLWVRPCAVEAWNSDTILCQSKVKRWMRTRFSKNVPGTSNKTGQGRHTSAFPLCEDQLFPFLPWDCSLLPFSILSNKFLPATMWDTPEILLAWLQELVTKDIHSHSGSKDCLAPQQCEEGSSVLLYTFPHCLNLYNKYLQLP